MVWAEADLADAWHALGTEAPDGWRFIAVGTAGGVRFEAGLSPTEGREAVIAVFPASGGAQLRLPEGYGFDIIPLDDLPSRQGGEVIALVRRAEGEIGIFSTMAIDVLRCVERQAASPVTELRKIFIRRVKDWQDFMATARGRPLSPEQQTGLFGELCMFERLSASEIGGAGAVGAWMGPRRAAQDFHVRLGAVEVKSATSTEGFPAKINSLDQLDTERAPMVLAALRFREATDGRTLGELIEACRAIADAADARGEFDAALIFSGWRDEHAPRYPRRLEPAEERFFLVNENFPSLRRTALSPAITSARYGMDLDRIEVPAMDGAAMFETFGMTHHGS